MSKEQDKIRDAAHRELKRYLDKRNEVIQGFLRAIVEEAWESEGCRTMHARTKAIDGIIEKVRQEYIA